MPKLIAKERFYYAGRNVESGEEFEAEQQDVGLLTNSVSPRARHPELRKTAVEPERVAAVEPPPAPQAAPEPFQAPPAPVQRRRYQRRDMRAKE